MSKEQFELMRFQEMETLYSPTFTKKEATETGKKLVRSVLDNGEVNKLHFIANLARLNEVISSAMAEARESIIDIEKTKELGVEFNPVNGGESLNYKEDDIYLTLFNDLKEREELLKLAYKAKNEFFDQYGNIIPKVSSTQKKSSVTIKF